MMPAVQSILLVLNCSIKDGSIKSSSGAFYYFDGSSMIDLSEFLSQLLRSCSIDILSMAYSTFCIKNKKSHRLFFYKAVLISSWISFIQSHGLCL